ncbi:unnamed protein product [Coffea canephora]|uniref:Protein kinase domain-containing protein n=1 Tax=Coffea canephora TaxID=49390 RepID=A0A068UGH5_COFCA|nr:unnamed protein product [Coffea canephora]
MQHSGLLSSLGYNTVCAISSRSQSILLDKEMNPKLSYFGMARISGGDETEANTRRVVGTYIRLNINALPLTTTSSKSDVFSFGVLVTYDLLSSLGCDTVRAISFVVLLPEWSEVAR